jgi:hypothetical protein
VLRGEVLGRRQAGWDCRGRVTQLSYGIAESVVVWRLVEGEAGQAGKEGAQGRRGGAQPAAREGGHGAGAGGAAGGSGRGECCVRIVVAAAVVALATEPEAIPLACPQPARASPRLRVAPLGRGDGLLQVLALVTKHRVPVPILSPRQISHRELAQQVQEGPQVVGAAQVERLRGRKGGGRLRGCGCVCARAAAPFSCCVPFACCCVFLCRLYSCHRLDFSSTSVLRFHSVLPSPFRAALSILA